MNAIHITQKTMNVAKYFKYCCSPYELADIIEEASSHLQDEEKVARLKDFVNAIKS